MLAYTQQLWMIVVLVAVLVVAGVGATLWLLLRKPATHRDLGPSGSQVAASLADRLAEHAAKPAKPPAEGAKEG